MPNLKSLREQGLALLEDQKKLVVEDTRPWSTKKPAFDKLEQDIKAVTEQYAALKAVDGDPFANTQQRGGPADVRVLKGIQAGIIAQGYQPIPAPQLDLDPEDA